MNDRKRKLQLSSVLIQANDLAFEDILNLIPNNPLMAKAKEVLVERFRKRSTLASVAIKHSVTKERVRQWQDRGLMYLFNNCLRDMNTIVNIDTTTNNADRKYITRSIP